MTEKFEKGLWKELQEISGDAYQPPAWVKMNNGVDILNYFNSIMRKREIFMKILLNVFFVFYILFLSF